MEMKDWSEIFFAYLYDGILIVNDKSEVQYINPAYTRITGIAPEEILGKPLKQIRPGARLLDVVTTGEPIVGALRRENGIDYTVNMSPIIHDGRTIGAISVVSHIDDVRRLSETLSRYQKELQKLETRMKAINRAKYQLDDIIAEDPTSIALKKEIVRIAGKDTTVVLLGESGTGKELYAQALHNASGRKDNSFIAVNCATFQKELLESELFGYEAGAFTGAKKEGKMGLFEAADKGTIFLDEISEMSWETQGHLLRALQEHAIRRIGGIKEIPVDIRVIAASNKNLEQYVREGKFREDLYYRIAIYPMRIPPLRERRDDILPLVTMYCNEQKNVLMKDIQISADAKEALYRYDWPGNVRELRNAVEFAVNVMEGNVIQAESLPQRIRCGDQTDGRRAVRNLAAIVKDAEQREIRSALKFYGEDLAGKKQAAKALGISLASLYNKLK